MGMNISFDFGVERVDAYTRRCEDRRCGMQPQRARLIECMIVLQDTGVS